MTWKTIGHSATGTSHIVADKPCEDAIGYEVVQDDKENEVLICSVSDGAGSAQFGGWASAYTVNAAVQALKTIASSGGRITEADIFSIVEGIYDGLEQEAETQEVSLDEYSCTLLGCYITTDHAAFFQVGDGAIVRNDGSDFYIPVWWPDNGEYQNTTSFIVDGPGLSNLSIVILEEEVNEVAIFSDGMQLLTLNLEGFTAHQPFFIDMFRYLRLAADAGKVEVLNRKLAEYLDSKQINDRTDDDKTLFLATRLE